MKLKKNVKIFLILFIVVFIVIFGGIKLTKYIVYINSDTYKLLNRGYSEKEVKLFIKILDEKRIKKLENSRKNEQLYNILKQKYFMKKNLSKYEKYLEDNPKTSYKDVIAIINTKANYKWYNKKQTKKTDMSKKDLILVNKFNYLEENYEPNDLKKISLQYAYNDNIIREHVKEAYEKMAKDAKSKGIKLIASSSYRDYKSQDILYERYKVQKGTEEADNVSARPGFSEHQTGLTLDILTDNITMSEFENTEEFKWLIKNAYKYGFILRYPKNKTYITGYSYEAWHYRYVGKKVAEIIHKENITFDEYYAYYIEK